MAAAIARPRRRYTGGGAGALGLGIATLWLSLIVLLPLAAVVDRSVADGLGTFWGSVTSRQAVAALRFTLLISLLVTAINVGMGTLIAWVLVRDDFKGKRAVNAVIDLPFALPTIVAGLTLLALYGQAIAFTKWAVLLALLFVTLPFVVRAVQPVLIELDREMEQAAHSLGASNRTTFRRIVLPNLVPAIVSGAALAFARAVGEFGSIVLISGNKPFDTQVSSVYAYKQLESDNITGAAAVSLVLLALSLLVLVALRFIEGRHVHRDGYYLLPVESDPYGRRAVASASSERPIASGARSNSVDADRARDCSQEQSSHLAAVVDAIAAETQAPRFVDPRGSALLHRASS